MAFYYGWWALHNMTQNCPDKKRSIVLSFEGKDDMAFVNNHLENYESKKREYAILKLLILAEAKHIFMWLALQMKAHYDMPNKD